MLVTKEKLDQCRMCFMVGRGRSGSSLLNKILNQSKNIISAPEALIILHLSNKYRTYSNFNAQTIDSFINDLYSEERFLDWNIKKQDLLEFLLDHLPIIQTFQDIIKLIYLYYGVYINNKDIEQINYIIDKNPVHSLHIKKLASLFPNSKFIYLIRNPKANIISFKNVTFDFNDTIILAYRWEFFNKSILNDFQKIDTHSYLTVRYEDLVQDEKNQLARIFDFLKISAEYSELLNFHKNTTRNIEISNFDPAGQNLRKPIDKKLASTWKEKMSLDEQKKVDAILFHFLQKNNLSIYIEHKSSRAPKRLLTLHDYLIAYLFTFSEKIVFGFPLSLRSIIMFLYRRLTKTNLHYQQ